jgi:hypothetical protein
MMNTDLLDTLVDIEWRSDILVSESTSLRPKFTLGLFP